MKNELLHVNPTTKISGLHLSVKSTSLTLTDPVVNGYSGYAENATQEENQQV